MVPHIPGINKNNVRVSPTKYNGTNCPLKQITLPRIKVAKINDNYYVLKRAEMWQGFIFIKAVVV